MPKEDSTQGVDNDESADEDDLSFLLEPAQDPQNPIGDEYDDLDFIFNAATRKDAPDEGDEEQPGNEPPGDQRYAALRSFVNTEAIDWVGLQVARAGESLPVHHAHTMTLQAVLRKAQAPGIATNAHANKMATGIR